MDDVFDLERFVQDLKVRADDRGDGDNCSRLLGILNRAPVLKVRDCCKLRGGKGCGVVIILIPAAPLTKSSSARLEHVEQAMAICGAVETGVYFDRNSRLNNALSNVAQENRPDADPCRYAKPSHAAMAEYLHQHAKFQKTFLHYLTN